MQLALFRSQEMYKVFVQKGTICQLVPFSPHLFLNQHEHFRAERYHMTNGTLKLPFVLKAK